MIGTRNAKTRGNYSTGGCLKDCENNGTMVCDDCYRFDRFVKVERQPKESQNGSPNDW